MKLYLTSVDGKNEDHNINITACILSNGLINILFQEPDEDGKPAQGRLSLKPISNKRQSTIGYSISLDTKKADASFSERQRKPEVDEYKEKAKITGMLSDYDGESIVFMGDWVDGDGKYEIEIDAKITKKL